MLSLSSRQSLGYCIPIVAWPVHSNEDLPKPPKTNEAHSIGWFQDDCLQEEEVDLEGKDT